MAKTAHLGIDFKICHVHPIPELSGMKNCSLWNFGQWAYLKYTNLLNIFFVWLFCSDVSSRSLCSGCFGSSRDSCGVSKLLLLLLQLLLLFLLLSSLERSVLTNKRSILLKANYKKEKKVFTPFQIFGCTWNYFSGANLEYSEISIQFINPSSYQFPFYWFFLDHQSTSQ